ncbi:FAD-binding protein [Haloarchaeobius salinus]|uniref:FAD-binding protein n=1 Tax=Haloarchaeobius salinus TaxID=1198298 RepID=UPI00210BCE3C|nr:FAD-binding protein [Haloarchaeobius salinus]
MDADVCIVGGGVAGLAAGIFTSRADLATVVVDDEESILRRNAHLENYPGFPFGVDARRLLERTREQARIAGCSFRDGLVTDVGAGDDGGFTVTVDEDTVFTAERVVAASWSDASYLDGLGVETETRGSKTYVLADREGRTNVDGIYAAGRLADQYHQAIVCAGHGATVGRTIVHDSDVNFYHDWVTPEGYFTGRGREVPPGCAEIDDAERMERDERAREALRPYTEMLDDEPTMHPSVVAADDEEN